MALWPGRREGIMEKSLSDWELKDLRESALLEIKGNLEVLSCLLGHWPSLAEDFDNISDGFSWIVKHCLDIIADMEREV
jgi:hypothetical protein